MQKVLEYIAKEWAVLKQAPGAFIGLVLVCLAGGFGAGLFYYSGQIATIKGQFDSANNEIGRYRVALGIDKASQGNLIALTNDELRAKSLKTASDLRSICKLLREKGKEASKTESKLDQKKREMRARERIREESDEIDRTVRSDTILVDNELRRRLDPKAIAAIPGLPRSLYDAVTGTPVEAVGLATTGGNGFSFMLCVLADGIEQMAKLLPSDGKR